MVNVLIFKAPWLTCYAIFEQTHNLENFSINSDVFSCEKPLVDPQLAAPEPALLSQANLQPEEDKTKLKKVKGKKKKKKKPKKVVGNHTIASKKSVHPGSSTKKTSTKM